MASLYWMNPNTGDTAFTLEFDESVVESEFSELVYGLIENANGDAHRQNETIASQRECIKALRNDALAMSQTLADNLEELAEYKAEYVPPASRRNGVSITDWLTNEPNNMGDKMYDKSKAI